MKRFITWVAVVLLVAVAVTRWRRMKEPSRRVPSGRGEEPAPRDPGTASQPAGSVDGAARRAGEGERAGEPESQVRATPAAERMAEELGVDLSRVEGTGSAGRVTAKDVRNAARLG
jgi:pyruvate dehydrogenase E2 component (dihydrolipoamide acetyltransferase)